MVAAGHPLSARAGAEALRRGGNAVDGACAAAFAGAVTESMLTGPGGGGFLLARDPAGHARMLDFFVAVPGAGPGGRRLDPAELGSFTVPFGGAEQEFHIGPASVAVPGMLPGLVAAARQLGHLPLPELVEPAIRLAREGFTLRPEGEYLHGILHDMVTHTPEAAAVFEPAGRPPRAGDTLRFPELGDTLEEVAAGPGAAGALADAMADHVTAAGGLLNRADLAAYEVLERTPLETRYRGLQVLTNPPPSRGGSLIAAALDLLDGWPAPVDDVTHFVAVAEAGREANRLRDAVSQDDLRADDALARLRALSAGWASRKPTGTTHVSVVDADGGSASLSSSNGSGSGVMVPGTGVLLNNMLGEEDLNPGGFGRLAPGLRMGSMMAPTLLLRDGEPLVVLGSAGSNRLRSAILQTVVSVVDGHLGLDEAVRRPRVHPEGGGLDVEAGVSEAACERLQTDGFRLRRWGEANLFFGGVAAAGHEANGLCGAGDPRRGGGAFGLTRAGQVVPL